MNRRFTRLLNSDPYTLLLRTDYKGLEVPLRVNDFKTYDSLVDVVFYVLMEIQLITVRISI